MSSRKERVSETPLYFCSAHKRFCQPADTKACAKCGDEDEEENDFILPLFGKDGKLTKHVDRFLAEARVKALCESFLGFDPYSEEEEKQVLPEASDKQENEAPTPDANKQEKEKEKEAPPKTDDKQETPTKEEKKLDKRKRSAELEDDEQDEKRSRTSVEVPRGPRGGFGVFEEVYFGGLSDKGRSDRGRDTRALSGTPRGGLLGRNTNPRGQGVAVVPFENRDLKWCLLCHWSDHNTANCGGGQEVTRESMCADLQWIGYNRGAVTRWLWNEPKDILETMDHLTTHQQHMARIEEWFAERDNLLQAVMEDEEWMARLGPVLGEGETAAGVYEAQIVAANNATKAFAVNVAGAVFLAFKQLVTGNRVKVGGETALQFRARLAAEVMQAPENYPVHKIALQKLVTSLERLRTTYTTRMDELETKLLQKRYPGRGLTLSRAEQRIIRLPTCYFRMEEVRVADDKPLWLPVFQPSGLEELEDYKNDEVPIPGDELYRPVKAMA